MNIETVTVTDAYTENITEHIIITNDDGSKISMLKATYDEMQAKQNEGKLN